MFPRWEGRKLKNLVGVLSKISLSFLSTTLLISAFFSVAQAEVLLISDEYIQENSVLISQWDGDDSYDPFADYSEFEAGDEEEADINFFKNGRLFTLSFAVGYRNFTGSLASIYDASTAVGIYLNYFFDLRFSMQIGFQSGSHGLQISSSDASVTATGSVSITAIAFSLKYYMSTQNVTRGLANLNPYFIGGFSQFHRTTTITNEVTFAKDSAVGVDLGAGIEIPMLRGKMFIGLQGVYHFVNFSDENQELTIDNQNTGIKPAGDIFQLQAVLGVNF